ncbi:MAG TPA: type VI secretion system protein, partial [Thermoanaerobaculia bacterium]
MAGMWPYALAAVLIVALVVLILLLLLLRKSAKQTEFVDAEEPPPEEPKPVKDDVIVADIPAAFRRAAKLIDREADGDRKNVPLFLCVGDRGSRDSDLLANAGLELTWGLPDEAGTALGEGRGFWIFGGGVVLDVVGEELGWDSVITQLQRLRPKRPIDGIIFTFSCAELVDGITSETKRTELAARAAKTYRKVWDAQQRLGFRLPAYVLITGCESVAGFQALCRSLLDLDRRQIVGWSNPNSIDANYRTTWIDDALQSLVQRLEDVAMEVLSIGTKEGDALLRLLPGLTTLGTSLRPVLDGLFRASAYHGTLSFRGLYFCGRERPAATHDGPPSGPVAFLAELFEKKIFAEYRLASPTTQTVMARNRAVTVAKSIAAAAFGFALLSILWSALMFRRQNAVLEPVLSSAAEAMEKNDATGVSSTTLGKNAISLLNGMSAITFDRYDSIFVPVSWADPFQDDLEHAFTDAFHNIILRAIREDLRAKAKKLVPLDEGRIESLGTIPTVVDRNVPSPWLADPVVPVASLREFSELQQYVNDLHELDENIIAFNGLHDSGDLRQVGKLVRYSFGVELDASFYRKAHLYRHALVEAEYRRYEPSVAFREAASRKLVRLSTDFHDALFLRNGLTARLDWLKRSVETLTWQPPANGDTEPLRKVAEQLRRIDGDLAGAEMEWAFRRDFDFGPKFKELVDNVATTSFLGPKAAEDLRGATKTRW